MGNLTQKGGSTYKVKSSIEDLQKNMTCALVNIFWTQNYKNYSVTA